MNTIITTAVLLILLAIISPAQEREAQKAAYDDYTKKLEQAVSNQEKITISLNFIHSNLRSPYFFTAVRNIKNSIVAVDGTADRAIDLIDGLIPKLDKQYGLIGIKFILMECYSQSNRKSEFRKVADEYLAAIDTSKSLNHWSVARFASECGENDFALELIGAVQARLQKNYEERTGSSKSSTRRILAGAMADKGIILTRAGRIKEALDAFNQASGIAEPDVFGQPIVSQNFKGEMASHWARALRASGDLSGAMEKMAYAALIKSDKAALADLREIYSEVKGNDANLDQFLHSKHNEFAKPVPEFSLKDLKGNLVSSQSFRGKVTLVYIWSHT